MRLIAQGKDPLEGQRHMCGMGNMFHYHSTGFPELDELMRTPQPLIFIMELLQVSTSKTLYVTLDSNGRGQCRTISSLSFFNEQLFYDFRFWADSKKRHRAYLSIRIFSSIRETLLHIIFDSPLTEMIKVKSHSAKDIQVWNNVRRRLKLNRGSSSSGSKLTSPSVSDSFSSFSTHKLTTQKYLDPLFKEKQPYHNVKITLASTSPAFQFFLFVLL